MTHEQAPLVPLTPDQARHFDWMTAPHLRRIVDALTASAPGAARYVGGCVRDSLRGIAPKDVDIAVAMPPEKSLEALDAAGIRAVPTGLAHGTVTAVFDAGVAEITSLRADVATDGRRAVVAFTDDWREDAKRRDFTVNALYLTPDGALYDPEGGIADLAAGRVRFIGAAADRIREDYLRIMRFFRFSARFASDAFDPDGLAACAELRAGIAQLSAERVGQELSALLALPAPGAALRAMQESGVLGEIYPGAADLSSVERLKRELPEAAPALVAAALWGAADNDDLNARLRWSNAVARRRANAPAAADLVAASAGMVAARGVLYRIGQASFRDGVWLAKAQGRINAAQMADAFALADHRPPPAFSLGGDDAIAAGVAPGPDVGAVLRAVEQRWIAADFPDEAWLKAALADEVASRRS